MPPNPDPEADGGPALPQAPPSRFSTATTALPSRFSTVSYNVYNTVTSVSSDSSYNAYDTMSSTATDMTGVGESMEELHLTVAGLETHRQDAGANKKQEIASLDFSTKNSDYSPQNGGVLADWRSDPCGKAGKYGRRKLPILGWLPQYCTDWAVADMIAGVTVGLTIIPQGIAYANIAGLPPQYGLYSSIMGCFAYIVFGSEKDINIGPTAIMALMTKKISIYGPEYAVLLTLLSGVIILAAGLLKLGFLIDFISLPVTAGFCSAAAVTIASSQLRSLLGVAVNPEHKSHTHAGVVDYYIDLVQNRDSLRWQDATLGLTCAAIILTLRAVNRAGWFQPLGSGGSDGWVRRQANRLNTRALAVLDKVVWFVCTARNAIVVIFCLGLAAVMDPDIEACMEDRDNCTFTLTGNIQSGLPIFQSPPFSLAGNLTSNGEPVSFPGMVGKLGISIIIVPIVAIVDAVAIAKAFAGGRPVDASQEMVSVGVANILGSFVGAMPTTHSLSRAAVNSASGVRTPMGGGYTGALVLLCLAFLMPYCAFIPKATLAAVIVCAILFSVEHHIVKPMWEASRLDLVPGFISFFVGVFYELEMGIFSGMGVHIAIVLYNTARPNVAVEIRQVSGQHYLSVTPDQGISFPSVSYLRSLVSKAGIRQGQSSLPVVIQCEHISSVDFTAASSFKAMLEDFTSRDQAVYWHNPGDRLAATLTSAVGESFRVITAPEDILSDCVENSLRRCCDAGKETPWSQEQQDKEEKEQQKKQEDHKLSMEP